MTDRPAPYVVQSANLSPVEEAVRCGELRGMSPEHLRSAAAMRNRDAQKAEIEGRPADALFLEGIRDALEVNMRRPTYFVGRPSWEGMAYAAGYAIAAATLGPQLQAPQPPC